MTFTTKEHNYKVDPDYREACSVYSALENLISGGAESRLDVAYMLRVKSNEHVVSAPTNQRLCDAGLMDKRGNLNKHASEMLSYVERTPKGPYHIAPWEVVQKGISADSQKDWPTALASEARQGWVIGT